MGFHPDPIFAVQDQRRNGVARLALRGELDLATAPKLEEHLMLVERDGVWAVLLDLRELTFLDCMALQTFMKAKRRAEENGHRLAIVGANDLVRRLLQLTDVEGTVDEAKGLHLLAIFTQGSSNSAPPRTSVGAEWGSDG